MIITTWKICFCYFNKHEISCGKFEVEGGKALHSLLMIQWFLLERIRTINLTFASSARCSTSKWGLFRLGVDLELSSSNSMSANISGFKRMLRRGTVRKWKSLVLVLGVGSIFGTISFGLEETVLEPNKMHGYKKLM